MELINDNVLVRERDILPLNLLQIEVCIIYHVCKVYLIALFQHGLIVMIDLLGNIQKQKRSRIVCSFSQNSEAAIVITGCFVLFNKLHHKDDQLINVLVFPGFYNLLIDFFQITRL